MNGVMSPFLHTPSRCPQLQFCLFFISIIIIIGIQPLGRSGQRPELSQSTGITLIRCILGKFLGVVCHCFTPFISIYRMKCLKADRRHEMFDIPQCTDRTYRRQYVHPAAVWLWVNSVPRKSFWAEELGSNSRLGESV